MKHTLEIVLIVVASLLLFVGVAFAATIEQANVIDGNTYKPAVKVNGTIYETPYRFSTTLEAEQWVLNELGITATALRNIGGVDEDAAGNEAGSGSGF